MPTTNRHNVLAARPSWIRVACSNVHPNTGAYSTKGRASAKHRPGAVRAGGFVLFWAVVFLVSVHCICFCSIPKKPFYLWQDHRPQCAVRMLGIVLICQLNAWACFVHRTTSTKLQAKTSCLRVSMSWYVYALAAPIVAWQVVPSRSLATGVNSCRLISHQRFHNKRVFFFLPSLCTGGEMRGCAVTVRRHGRRF